MTIKAQHVTAVIDDGQRKDRLTIFLLMGATALVALIGLLFLTKFPPVFVDEPWYANTAWNWLQTGANIDPMHASARPFAEWPYLGNMPMVLSFALFGVGLAQARFVSWCFGLVLLLATAATGRRLYGSTSGWLGALFLALSWPFLQASHYARPDVMLAAVIMSAYALANKSIFEGKRWPSIAAGFLLAIALDVHLNAVVFAFGFGALYLAAYGREILRRTEPWMFVLGGVLGFAVYAVFHFDAAQDFLGILPSGFALGNTHQPPILSFDLSRLLLSARDEVGRFHFYSNSLDFALIGASTVLLVVRRSKADKLLLSFIAAAIVGFVLIVGAKHDVYAILLYPFFMLIVAEAIVSLVRAGQGHQPSRVFPIALLALFLVNSSVHMAQSLFTGRNYDYYRITERLDDSIQPGSRVMAMPYWWLGLADHSFQSSLNLTYYHFFQGLGMEQALSRMEPDYLIVDDGFNSLLVNDGYYPTGAGFNAYLLPREEFVQFMAKRATLVTEFEDPWHGDIAVYAIDWFK